MNYLKFVPLYAFAALFLSACSGNESKEMTSERDDFEAKRKELALLKKAKEKYTPLPFSQELEKQGITEEKIQLGKTLFFDKQLSKEGNISCNSCHNLETFGVDNLPTSPGDLGQNGDRNSPTVLNASIHSSQFWDGRAKDVEEQAGMPILNPVEMAIPHEKFLIERLQKDQNYVQMFSKAFPGSSDPVSYKNLQNAIGAFERTLITPSRFDQYLLGSAHALTKEEKEGMVLFSEVGCTTCHSGPALGGTTLQKFGVHDPYWEYTGSKHRDNGRFSVTGEEFDKYMFKVPSLRNIEKTGPYFHDGSVEDLDEAVRIMAKVQLNKRLSDDQVKKIVAFLGSLTGKVPESALLK